MSGDNRVQMTLRMRAEDKEVLRQSASAAGLEAGVATRQVMELFVAGLAANDGDFIDTLQTLKNAMKPRVRVPARTA